jgi:transcriptional regulator with XRE-family HTH domain
MLTSGPMVTSSGPSFGDLLRGWRQRRHMSQLALACEAEISTRHLSFLETGRSSPSREMILQLCATLDVPLRERNSLLHAAGFAPAFAERPLADPALASARRAVDLVLKGHEPYPALAVDRHWILVAMNDAVPPLLAGVAAPLLAPPVNVLRLSLHPQGMAPRIVNFAEWRRHVLERLRAQVERTADARLAELEGELRALPAPDRSAAASRRDPKRDYAGVVVPLELATDAGVMAFFSTTTVFGTPVDITLSELALEAFFPADEATRAMFRPTSSAQWET